MLRKISVIGGYDKIHSPEAVERLDIMAGEVVAVVGPTGSGKTQLISDIGHYAGGEMPTGRSILINDMTPESYQGGGGILRNLVAEVSQKMNFVIDATVEEFLLMHAKVLNIADPDNVVLIALAVTNSLAGEPVFPADNLTVLSGGQARALMVADVALLSNAPVVLIDEIENAGIDRLRALEILTGHGKAVLVVTHDPTLTLMAEKRVVMKNGGMYMLRSTGTDEKAIMAQLVAMERYTSRLRNSIRNGECVSESWNSKEEALLWQRS
jgi:ABC-type lipoprotein export system ATPase subunit